MPFVINRPSAINSSANGARVADYLLSHKFGSRLCRLTKCNELPQPTICMIWTALKAGETLLWTKLPLILCPVRISAQTLKGLFAHSYGMDHFINKNQTVIGIISGIATEISDIAALTKVGLISRALGARVPDMTEG